MQNMLTTSTFNLFFDMINRKIRDPTLNCELQVAYVPSNCKMTEKISLICFQDLWSVATGQPFAMQHPDLVEKELFKSVTSLKMGLNYYKEYSETSMKTLKTKKNISENLLTFLSKSSEFLSIDAIQMNQLYNNFASTYFRGSTDKLNQMLKEEKSSISLLSELSNYYFIERLYLLRSISPIIGHFQDRDHPYHAVYEKVVQSLPDIIPTLKKQFEESLKAKPVLTTKKFNCTAEMLKRISLQRWKEQCEILELIFLYHSQFPMPTDKLVELAKLFKEYDFGFGHPLVEHLDSEVLRPLVACMNALQQVILIEGFDMEFLQEPDAKDEHNLLKNKEAFNEINEIVASVADQPALSPLLLSWATVRHILLDDNGGVITQKLGERAISHKVWQEMATLVDVYPFNSESNIAMAGKKILREVLSCVTRTFHEDTLGEYSDLISIATLLLGNSAKDGNQGMQSCGLDALLLLSAGYFPLNIEPLLTLLSCMVKSQNDALQVHAFMSNLPVFAEYLATCTRDEVESLEDASVWRLLASKPIRTAGGLHTMRLPVGTIGHLVDSPYGEMVQWQEDVDGWKVLYAEIKSLLDYEGPSSNLELLGYFQKAEVILKLIESILAAMAHSASDDTACLAVLETLEIFALKIHRVIQRIVQTSPPPLKLIESCIRCLAMWMKINPQLYSGDIVAHLTQIQYLPSTDRFALSTPHGDDNVHPGIYGALLAECERPTGSFQVTVATIELITGLLESSLDHDHMMVMHLSCSVEFLLNEVFSSYHQWQKRHVETWDKIGIRCLQMCHVVLSASIGVNSTHEAKRNLQKSVVSILSCSGVGQVILRLACVNVDTLHAVAASEPFSVVATRLVETIQIGFSLLNNLLRVESTLIPTSDLNQRSYLHQVLATPNVEDNNLVSAVAGYLFHRQNLALPRLAISLLRRISLIAPMSLYACLGPDVSAIRNILLMRLKSRTEDTAIKVGILELFAVCAQTQPGLLELFLDLQFIDKDKPELGLKLGDSSCLTAVLGMLNPLFQGTYMLPPRLHTSCVKLLNALWVDRRHSALQALRSTSANEGLGFWSAVLFPLFSENSPKDIAQSDLLETCAHVINIVALEWFYTSGSENDKTLDKVMKEFSAKKRFEHWSKVLLCVTKTLMTSSRFERRRHQMFASAWRSFVSVAPMLDPGLVEIILNDLIDSITFLVDDVSDSGDDIVILDLISGLVLSLVYKQTQPKTPPTKPPFNMQHYLPRIVSCIQKAYEPPGLAKVVTNLHAAAIHVIKHSPPKMDKTTDDSCIPDLIETTCHHLTILLRDLDSQSLEIPILLVRSLEELFFVDETISHWLRIVSRESSVNLMMTVLVESLTSCPDNIDVIRLSAAIMRLLMAMSSREVTSHMLHATGLFSQLCLNLTNAYSKPNKKWLEVYHLSLVLMTRMIGSLSHDFIDDTLDFIGVHQDRMWQCLSAILINQRETLLCEVTHTTSLLAALSRDFTHQWKCKLRLTFDSALKHVLTTTHSCVAMLLQPRLLIKTAKIRAKKEVSFKSGSSLRMLATRKSLSKAMEEDTAAPEISAVQESLLSILGNCLDFLYNLSPNICQLMFDRGVDADEYTQLLAINFASPSLEQELEASYGSVIGAANIALSALHKMSGTDVKRSSYYAILTFVADISLVLLMSQCLLMLKQSHTSHRNKQLLKRELADELNSCVRSASRHLRHSSSSYSPHSSPIKLQPHQTGSSRSPATPNIKGILDLVTAFVKQLMS